jgi:hypothetical protein
MIPHRALRLISTSAILILAVSCAHYSDPVKQSFVPDADTVVLYGRFELEQNQDLMGYKFCLGLYDENSKREQFIPFQRRNPVGCIHVQSGVYVISGVAIIDSLSHRILAHGGYSSSNSPGPIVFEAEKGSAVYIGDFGGFYSTSVESLAAGVRHFTNNLAETTKTFHEQFPHLANLPIRSAFEGTNATLYVQPASN